jgi:hypothetical protein
MSDVEEFINSQLLLNREAFRAENIEHLRVFSGGGASFMPRP